MKKIKENKGITLIALVVTIIILLILAGVSISMLMGQNGIITQAGNAKEAQELGKVKDIIGMKYYDKYLEGRGKINKGTALTYILNELKKEGYETKNTGAKETIEKIKGVKVVNTAGQEITELKVEQDKSIEIKLELEIEKETSGEVEEENQEGYEGYVKVNNKWYRIEIDKGRVELIKEDIEGGEEGERKEYSIRITKLVEGNEITLSVLGEEITEETKITNETIITIQAGRDKGTYKFKADVKVEEEETSKYDKEIEVEVIQNEEYVVQRVEVEPTELILEKGQSGQLKAKVYPIETVSQNVTWESDDEEVAKVDNFGAITTGGKTGEATITVTSKEDENKFTTCTITVQPNVEVPSGWKKTTASDPLWYNYGATVNAPKLGEGMVPIVRTNEDGSTTKRWANAVTEDGSMWVWIPRYAYSIPSANYNTSTGGTVDIKFLKGTTNETLDGSSITLKNESGGGNWNVHPAFIDMNDTTTYKQNNPTTNPLGAWNKEITGIWVAKFEASWAGCTSTKDADGKYDGTDRKLQIKPGVVSWRSIKIGNIFTVCENYNSTLNSHLMKNSEWGAVVYLTQSQYGINSEIYWNGSLFVTGYAELGSDPEGYPYDHTTIGGKGSSTGNLYGIYDLRGSALEAMASYLNNLYIKNTSKNQYKDGQSLITSSKVHFKQIYPVGINEDGDEDDWTDYNWNAASKIYGDSHYETAVLQKFDCLRSWFSKEACPESPGLTTPFYTHGDDTGSTYGIFGFSAITGAANGNVGFRPCLVAE